MSKNTSILNDCGKFTFTFIKFLKLLKFDQIEKI